MPATLCVLVLTVPYLTSMPLTHKRRESAIMASPRRNQSNLLVMIAMGLVPTMALVANIDADNDPLVVLEMEGGTTSMTTPVTIIATANAVKATAALILEVVMTGWHCCSCSCYANTHISHHFVPPSTLHRAISVPTHRRFYKRCSNRALSHFALCLHHRPTIVR
ncbi:hypothetical protein DYB31_015781 [Aphanomyces astaci]|uniref:Uncharacterized protein n=2 Tax=Aphanomyces astaci TaxID=112090 RepID=A0A397ENH9_APHAT|nr:hypothetical protein DYB31_015781 [Aphanomyces astaci]